MWNANETYSLLETITYSLITITYVPKKNNPQPYTLHKHERKEPMIESISFTKAKAFTSLCNDCTELIKMLTSSVKTAKAK